MIGVLALQGDYSKHIQILEMLDFQVLEVRYPNELSLIEGLVIPGGESTTISDLMERSNFHEPIKIFAKKKPILGTCAGLIMMSKNINDDRIKSLDILDISVDRNAYGKQLDSFTSEIEVSLNSNNYSFSATFIRAPKIDKVGKNVKILSFYKNKPIVVKQGHHLGLAFHPELAKTTFFHNYIFREQFQVINAT
jgi:5'-phosphate synthase pdxT subunit